MVAGRKDERKTVIPQSGRHLLRSQLGRDAQRSQHVGTAGLGGDRAVAVLGHRHAGRRRHDSHGGGNVKRPQLVAAGAAHVEHLAPARLVVQRHGQSLVAQLTGERRDLIRRLALVGQSGQKIGLGLGGDGFISQAADRIANLLGAQRAAIGQLLGQGIQHDRNDTHPTTAWPSVHLECACHRSPNLGQGRDGCPSRPRV